MKISESKILYWLSLPYISARKQVKILNHFGNSPIRVWNEFITEKGILREFLGDKVYDELNRYRSLDYIDMSLEKLREQNIGIMTMRNPLFPKGLLHPEVNAPAVLYYKGSLDAIGEHNVAIVGTRVTTSYGKECTKTIASQLAKAGVTVVSGLATGVDAYAHSATLESGGKTVAVLGSGLNKITPVGNMKLFEDIVANGGLVLSEYKPDADATKFTFPERNRIISGLCEAVVVVEAGEKSGALITARHALEQNREVFAVPGNVTSSRSKGCNQLLYDGANMARDGLDILEQLKINYIESTKKQEIIVDKAQKKLYSFLESGPKTLDELVELTNMSLSELSAILLTMELDEFVEKQSANSYVLKQKI